MQIRNNLCYQNLPVTILGIGSGVSYGHLGFSHHSLEDVSTMYALPNMKIYLPCDVNEAKHSIEDSLKRGGPSYIRIRTGMEPVIYTNKQLKNLVFDKPVELKRGNDVLIITYGSSVYQSLLAAEALKSKNISTGVLNMNSLGIYDPSIVLDFIQSYKLIAIVEEHYVHNGLGAILINEIYGKTNIPILKLGMKKEFIKFGNTGDEIISNAGIDSINIEEKILESLNKK